MIEIVLLCKIDSLGITLSPRSCSIDSIVQPSHVQKIGQSNELLIQVDQAHITFVFVYSSSKKEGEVMEAKNNNKCL